MKKPSCIKGLSTERNPKGFSTLMFVTSMYLSSAKIILVELYIPLPETEVTVLGKAMFCASSVSSSSVLCFSL
jgi:hypothetical protein